MTREVTAQALINLPREQAWQQLRVPSLAHNYVPGIVKTKIVSDQTEGVGAIRYVYRNRKSYIQETVEDRYEGKGFLIRLHRGDKPAPPFKSAWFRYALADQGAQQTLLIASLQFQLPMGVLAGWLAGKEDGKICGRNGIRCGHVHETVLRDGPAHHRRGAEGLQSIKALTPAAISPPSRRLIEQQLASVCSGRSPPASGYFRSAPAAVVISRCIKIVCHPLNYSICSLY